MKILKSVLIIAAVVSMAVPSYAGIKPSNPAFITGHHSVTPPTKFPLLLTAVFQYPMI